MPQKLTNLENFLEGVHEDRIQENDDLVLLMIGNEGTGKSTAMLWASIFWQHITGREATVDNVLEGMVFGGREDYKDKLMNSDEGSLIAVQDAPHVLFSKDAMVGDQKDIEKAMFDMRIENYFVILGFQSWNVVPKDLRERRAEAAIRVYRDNGERGYMDIYGRRRLDEKVSDFDTFDWPDPDTEDRFDALEGTDIWSEFTERDAAAKRERLESKKQIDEKDARKQEHIKTAIRGRLLFEHDPLTWEQIAKLTDYSSTWCRTRFNEWQEGAYRDLISEDDMVHRVTAEVQPA